MDKTQNEILRFLKKHSGDCYTSEEIMREVEEEQRYTISSEEGTRQSCEKLIETDKIFRGSKGGGDCFQYSEI